MGKQMIMYVIGLSLIVGVILANVNANTVDSMDTYSLYYGRTMAHNIALAGANIGTEAFLRNPTTAPDIVGRAYSGGVFSMTLFRTSNITTLLSVSRYSAGGITILDTIQAKFQHTRFSKYGWFTEAERNGYLGCPYFGYDDWKITGDSVFGPAHSNGHFNLGGGPFFSDKVTATTAPQLWSFDGRNPVYNAGYQWGITVNRPLSNLTNLFNLAQSQGGLITNGADDVALNFIANGTVAVKIPPSTGAVRNDTVQPTTLAPSGVIVVNGADVRIKGSYSGQITVAALSGTTTNKGNVWIDGNGIVAANNPNGNPMSSDIMGIVAQKSTFIARDDTRNMSSVINIQAAVYCHEGELTAQDFWIIGKHGRVNLFGGVTQATAGSLGVFDASGLTNGMFYSVRHDPRFLLGGPPSYPFSDKYELVAWWEK